MIIPVWSGQRKSHISHCVFYWLCPQANGNRDALAKALYCRTVAAIVRRVNSYKRTASLQPPAPPSPRGSQESLRVSSTGSSWSLGRSTQNLGSGLLMTPLTGMRHYFAEGDHSQNWIAYQWWYSPLSFCVAHFMFYNMNLVKKKSKIRFPIPWHSCSHFTRRL